MRLWPTGGLWRHPDFLRLWAAQIVSAFGSRITRTALPALAILTLGASDGDVALLGALAVAPAVLTGLVATRFIDVAPKRPLLIGADIARAVLVLTIPLAAWAGALTLWQVYAVAVLAGAATALFEIADQSWLPAIVGRDHLVEGNTKLTASDSIAEIAGPGLAGVLIHLLTAPVAILIDAVSFLWSAFFLARVREHGGAPAETHDDPVEGAWQGLAAIWRDPFVRPIFLAEAIGMTGWGFFAALYMLFTLRELDLGIEIVGLIIGVGGIGAFAGAAICGPIVRSIGAGRALLLFIVLNMGAALLIPLAAYAGPLMIVLLVLHQLLGDGFGAAFSIQATALRQTAIAPAVLGRVNAAFVAMHAAALLTGALVAAPLTEWLGILPAVIIGVALQCVAILPILSPRLLALRRVEDAAPNGPARPPSAG
jgi:MFS family permease